MKYFSLVFLTCLPLFLFSNNIQISNVRISDQNTTDDYYMIEFDISWENSWRTSTMESNWDAAWVFIKYSLKNHHDWQHATLHYIDGFNDGHLAPPGATVQTYTNTPAFTDEGVGVMIYRSSDGIGDVYWKNVQLRWDYGTDLIGDNSVVELSIFGIEMVYVPQGAFFVGSGDINSSQLGKANNGAPFLIDSENSILLGGIGPNQLSSHNDDAGVGDDFNHLFLQTLPAEFPKGYEAFYCMKYEASQQQYADFLTHLSPLQRDNRNENGEENFGIHTGNHYAVVDFPWRPMGNLGWPDIAAYLDWSGLRLMTELEYEKACRGPLDPISQEFAWGNSSLFEEALTLEHVGEENEIITGPLGYPSGYSNIASPATFPRCGIFAASAINKTRQETGGSYWGIMEMSSNCPELVLSIGKASSRTCQGLHGDGEISNLGEATVDLYNDWAPATGEGLGWREGPISSREYMSDSFLKIRYYNLSLRGVRSVQ
ncbi:MAG: SUMF1/EgtB/PvdO family nonheme iron enzyme [Bacteroidota bacterium]